MRSLPIRAVLAALAVSIPAQPVLAGWHATPPADVLITTWVDENTHQGVSPALWRKLVGAQLPARVVAAEDGATLADDERCRRAHALYAVLATFERATRLPGLALDTDRAYGIARFTVRNCVSGTVSTKTLRLESEPLSAAERRAEAQDAEARWNRALRLALARDPLVLNAAR